MSSLPKPLLALVRPDRAFVDWRPPLRLAVAAVLLVAVVNAVGVVLAADAVAGGVSGTVTVDNPDRPPEVMCESFGDDGPFADDPNVSSGVTEDCRNEPETVNVSLADAARDGASGQMPVALFAPVVGWLLAGALGLLFVGEDAVEGYGEVLAVVGWGFLPAAVRYAVRPVAVGDAAAGWQHPTGDPAAVEAAARTFLATEPAGWFALVVAATLAWQAAVLGLGVAAVAGVPRRSSLSVFGVPAALLAGASLTGAGPVLEPAVLVASVVLLGLGVAHVAAPRVLIGIETTFELIGMRGREHVEPAGWYVWLTRALGAGMLLVAFVVAGGLAFG